MRYVFLFNPVAGKQNAFETYSNKIKAYMAEKGFSYQLYQTEYPGHARELSERAAQREGPVRIYGFGGDGTLCEIANGAMGFENAEIGIFPCGSGNDYIRTFGEAGDFLSIDRQLNGRSRVVDMIKTEKMLSLNLCSMGLDAAVAMNMVKYKKLPLVTGSMAYDMALIKCLLGKLYNHLTVTIDDGEPITGDFIFALAGSGQYYGGGYRGAPQADPGDGLLDFVMIRNVRRTRLPGMLPVYKSGGHLQSEKFKDILFFAQGKKMKIHADTPAVVNFDGECQKLCDISFEVIPKAVRFIVPDVSR